MDDLEDLEMQWRIQYLQMQEALEDVRHLQSQGEVYGGNLDIDGGNEDEDDEIFEEMTYASCKVDFKEESQGGEPAFGRGWFEDQCRAYWSRHKEGMEESQLKSTLMSLLSSKSNDEELSMSLAEIIGFDDLDFVMELVSHRKDILKEPEGPVVNGRRLLSEREQQEALQRADREHKSRGFGPKLASEALDYPHIYRAHEAGNSLDSFGRKYKLPPGSTREEKKMYTEITVPAAKVGTLGKGRKLVAISEMDMLCQNTFRGYKSLNRMQSLVHPVAYGTNENMLICAPTGAGKTDAAMLTILNTIGRNCIPSPLEDPTSEDFVCQKEDFKIIYVAPMKALAAEIVEKLGKRLAWLGIQVRELTGDMHLTKQEIVQTQIIVTTPEKWDVVTRKSTGDTELVSKVRLLIIDEVHMLHDERGAVLESLVARTQRQVETTQTMIRIVGLSATLPNFVDVADFLRVNPYAGLFYFDASFRPVPLEQHFLGAKGKVGTKASNENIERTAYEKVKEMLERGHQVMVFVHSRKDTVKTARAFYQLAMEEDCIDLFSNQMHENYERGKKDMDRSKLRELRDLYQKGFGVHHAGMLRTDRNLVERLFGDGLIKVLCCTATLAWGVNLPAAAVVIKGTQIYNPEKGSFMDLGILDVLQIFGRAGRPQFQDTGIGYIVTSMDKMDHYLSAVTQQLPIESQFGKRIVDNLNAEVSLGTVTNIHEAVTWVGYSYMYVRWKKNPLFYGIDWNTLIDDPHLVQRRRELIISAAKTLAKNQMIAFNETTESMSPKDIGRIASDFYILHQSIEVFNKMLKPRATEADILGTLSQSHEFGNITARDSEHDELQRLKTDICPCQIPKKVEDSQAKTNILLQTYISDVSVDDFALISDINYVAQNSARICRALFQISLIRRWGHLASVLLSICKSIEKKLWSFRHPLAQFNLPHLIIKKLEERESASHIDALRDMTPGEIGDLVHNQRMGPTIHNLLDRFPTLHIESQIAPLNREVLRVRLFITPEFKWDDRIHGAVENYWIWVENSDTQEIIHYEYFMLSKKKFHNDHEMSFSIPLSDPLPTQIYVRAISDRWLGAETVDPVSFQHLIRPNTEIVYTELLNLPPVPITELKNPVVEGIYAKKFQFFNSMQTQLFPYLYHNGGNVLVGSPTGSGKTVACEIAMWRAFREAPKSKIVYIAPMKALVRERVNDWGDRLRPTGKQVVELTGDNTPDTRSIARADIIITTPEKWDGISRSWQSRDYVKMVSLVIIDEIHLLGGDRGPVLEAIVSRMNYISRQTERPVRIMGMSTAAANARDLGDWLNTGDGGLFNFRHSTRPVPLEIHIEGFPEIRGFCPLMQSMNRPTFLAIKAHSPNQPVIVFVASRRQTRLTAKDLIAFCGMEDNPRRFLNIPDEDELHAVLSAVKDDSLKEALSFGIGLHHAGLVDSDRSLVENLFLQNKILVLVATATLAWGVNLPAHLVVVKGTQFYDAKLEGYKDMDLTDVMQMLGRAGRPQFDTSGIACIFTQESKKPFYRYFLNSGFPVESSLHQVLDDHLSAEINSGTIKKKEDAMNFLACTFLHRRLPKNPTYYGLEIPIEDQDSLAAEMQVETFSESLVDKAINELHVSGCILAGAEGKLETTALGKIASYYYISHKTIRYIAKHAKRQATIEDCLSWMCSAIEYDELPVRHNEDLINVQLAAALPMEPKAMSHLPMWDPHIKAFLLLQAYISRIDLPISDYLTDQNSVLDQSIRIIQASIEVLLEMRYLSSVLQMVRLLQSIKQAVWPETHPLAIFPGVQVEKVPASVKEKLEDLPGLPATKLESVLNRIGVPNAQLNKAKTLAQTLPALNIDLSKTESTIALAITRESKSPNKDFRIYAPKFPKAQTEGYFAILGDEKRDIVYDLKRCGFQPGAGSREGAKMSVSLSVPEGVNGEGLKVWVLCDGYPVGYERVVG